MKSTILADTLHQTAKLPARNVHLKRHNGSTISNTGPQASGSLNERCLYFIPLVAACLPPTTFATQSCLTMYNLPLTHWNDEDISKIMKSPRETFCSQWDGHCMNGHHLGACRTHKPTVPMMLDQIENKLKPRLHGPGIP